MYNLGKGIGHDVGAVAFHIPRLGWDQPFQIPENYALGDQPAEPDFVETFAIFSPFGSNHLGEITKVLLRAKAHDVRLAPVGVLELG
jgi:hypothetical protein